MAVIAQRPGFMDADQQHSEHHSSWFPGQEATPIGTDQRTALTRAHQRTRTVSLRKTMLTVAFIGLAFVVLPFVELPKLGVEHVVRFGFGLIGVVVLSAIAAGAATVVRRKRPRHARPGRFSRVLKGGGAHV